MFSGLWLRNAKDTTSSMVRMQINKSLVAIKLAHNVTHVEKARTHIIQTQSPGEGGRGEVRRVFQLHTEGEVGELVFSEGPWLL